MAELERYSRQLVLPEFGPEGQKRLKESSVVVVGAGGLGLPASIYLVAAGVGRLRLIDDDIVEMSNLHRQTLYTKADIGRPKVEVAAERLERVNPHVFIDPQRKKLDSADALDSLGGFDVVLDCTDNFPARYLISDACLMLRRPDIYASVFRFDGQASVFDGDSGPCYRCLFPTPPPPDSVQDCAEAGVLGVLPGIMGSVQAAQALSIIRGAGKGLVGRLLVVDANDMTFTELSVKKNPRCPACGDNGGSLRLIDYEEFCGARKWPESGVGIAPIELKRWLDGRRKVVLLDVRGPFEYAFCRLEGSKLIPLVELPKRLGELDPEAETVVYCHRGNRSAAAVTFLSSRGFKKVWNLDGGTAAWASQVDPSMPKY
jgi:adenylyltransferase/sulfurtransferase